MSRLRFAVLNRSGALVIAATLGLSGCPSPATEPVDASTGGDDTSVPDPGCDGGCMGPVCTFVGPEFMGTATEGLAIGLATTGTFVPWSNGETVTYVWGPQGGTMIQPVLSIDGALAPGAPCVIVELQNIDPAGGGRYDSGPGFTLAFHTARVGDRLLIGPLLDPFGRVDLPLGTPLRVDVTVTGATFSVHGTVDLLLGGALWPAPPGHDCSSYRISDGPGCRYRIFPGRAQISAVETAPSGEANCTTDPRHVSYLFVPDPAVDTGCFLFGVGRTEALRTTSGYNPPASCLAPLGIVPGGEVPIERWESVGGTCSPVEYRAAGLLAPCDASCM